LAGEAQTSAEQQDCGDAPRFPPAPTCRRDGAKEKSGKSAQAHQSSRGSSTSDVLFIPIIVLARVLYALL